jgi:hypothetical protein
VAELHYCLDETSFDLPVPDGSSVIPVLEKLIDVLQQCRQENDDIGHHPDIYLAEILPNVMLYDLLFDPDYAELIDRETRAALLLALNRCIDWSQIEPVPADTAITISGKSLRAPSIALAHEMAGRSRAVACITLDRADRRSALPVARAGQIRAVYFVSADKERLEFERAIFELEDVDATGYIQRAPRAFPDLHLVPGLGAQFNRFSRPYRVMRPAVTRHLSALNDHFQAIFRSHQGAPDPTLREFAARCEIDCSPESPQTRRNAKAMRERQVLVDGTQITCEWHTKFEPTRNRIHFHPGSPKIANGRIVIGIFHEHLTV